MTGIYGHKWTAAFGEYDHGDTWAVGLAELTPEEIGTALRVCVESGEAWPPSLPEFRAMCRPQKLRRENEAMYRCPPSYQIEHKLTDDAKEKGRQAIEAARKAMRAKP